MLAPVIPFLRGYAEVAIIAVGTACDILKPFGVMRCDDESQATDLFDTIKPDLFVSAISSLTHGPYVNRAYIDAACAAGIPVVCLQDIWGNHRMPQNRGIISKLNAVCALDDYAASLWREDGFTGDIIITGNPAFAGCILRDVKKERKDLRAILRIDENDHVILFAGQGTPQHHDADKATFRFVADAIRLLLPDLPITLIARAHPRTVETAYYHGYSRDIKILDTSQYEFADMILPAVDGVIAMFSTLLVQACFMRIPAISVLLPQQGRVSLQDVGLNDFPPNRMGASIGIYDEESSVLADVIKHIFYDKEYRARVQSAQEKKFISDGKEGAWVVQTIIKYL